MKSRTAIVRATAVLATLLVVAACGSKEAANPEPKSSATPTSSPAPTSSSVQPTAASPSPSPAPAPPPAQDVDPLTGGPVHGGPAIAVKIDNTKKAFPQFGIAKADVVYVELVEGGLTRLIALFQSTLPEQIGPVRSVRSTDSTLLANMGSICLAFSGGAGGPMDRLAESPLKDCSHGAGTGYWRTKERSGSYNLMVDPNKAIAATQGVSTATTPGFFFAADDARVAAAEAGTTASAKFPAMTVGAKFADGGYQMTHSDNDYMDADGTAVKADNVLLFLTTAEPDGVVDTAGAPSMFSHSVGKGEFVLLRDGHALKGTWNRDKMESPFSFNDASGQPVPFKPGKTWVFLVPTNVGSYSVG